MPIELEGDGAGPGTPIVKKQALGEYFIGAMCAEPQRRQVHKPDGEPVFKKDGKPRYEIVVTCVTMPGTTATAGIGDESGVPEPGDVVRLIFRGGGFAQWIDALDQQKKAIGHKQRFHGRAGDIIEQTVEYGQAWSADGTKIGGELRTQAECDAVPRTQSLGYYGPLTMRSATAAEAEWDAKACELFRNADRPMVSAVDEEPPF
ncbi:MAG: hypothetical protein OEW46_12880 [Actinomycetota bacterium]|nr:hypothetical protein [Actinomycetota bacterium]